MEIPFIHYEDHNDFLFTVTGKYLGDLVLIDFIPTCFCHRVSFGNHKTWMQIAGEGKTFVKDQGDTIVSVTGCGDDLTVQPKRCDKFTAIRKPQKEVVILFDLEGGD